MLPPPAPPVAARGCPGTNIGPFVRLLQENQTDANGVLNLLRNAIVNASPGYSSGRMLITIMPSDGSHTLDLTLAPH